MVLLQSKSMKKLTSEDRYKVVQLARGGKPVREIAYEYNIAVGTVHNLVCDYKRINYQYESTNPLSRCDHSTPKCQCINNSQYMYEDYVRSAGIKYEKRLYPH